MIYLAKFSCHPTLIPPHHHSLPSLSSFLTKQRGGREEGELISFSSVEERERSGRKEGGQLISSFVKLTMLNGMKSGRASYEAKELI